MRAGDVDFVPEGAKDIGTCGGVAGEEGIANAIHVAVGSAATFYVVGGVRAEGAEGNGAM